MANKLPIAKEGWPFIAIPGALALGLALLGHRRLALPFATAAAASAGFFRDPERAIPIVANGVLSPADGRVISVDDAVDPFVGSSVRVAVFLSPLDVHVNRAPIAGRVTLRRHFPGRFGSLRRPEMVFENERATTVIEREEPATGQVLQVAVVQIASRLVRQIASFVEEGQQVALGQRIGVIRLGSQVDLVLPARDDLRVLVRPGQHLTAGESVVAMLEPLGAALAEGEGAAALQVGA